MGLQSMEAGELLSRTLVYPADDVDALLARIRAAVETERDAAWSCFSPHEGIEAYRELYDEECSALDALLADGGA